MTLTKHGNLLAMLVFGLLLAGGCAPDAGVGQGDAHSEYRRAMALEAEGEYRRAARLYRAAAEAGHAGAAYQLAEAYHDGLGVTENREEAASWFSRAADLGDPGAQYLVGSAYYSGTGVAQDYPRALGYLGPAAEQGFPPAQYLLAEAFLNGYGVPVDADWAARWYGKAAAQGHVQAIFAYGVMHAKGIGLPPDRREAYAWLLLARRAGHPLAESVLGDLAPTLSPFELLDAEKKAAAFVPKRTERFTDPPTIIYVQRALSALGFEPGEIDGVPGPTTRGAIRSYQAANGLEATGAITPALLESLLASRRAET